MMLHDQAIHNATWSHLENFKAGDIEDADEGSSLPLRPIQGFVDPLDYPLEHSLVYRLTDRLYGILDLQLKINLKRLNIDILSITFFTNNRWITEKLQTSGETRQSSSYVECNIRVMANMTGTGQLPFERARLGWWYSWTEKVPDDMKISLTMTILPKLTAVNKYADLFLSLCLC